MIEDVVAFELGVLVRVRSNRSVERTWLRAMKPSETDTLFLLGHEPRLAVFRRSGQQ